MGLLDVLGLGRASGTPATSTAPVAMIGPSSVPYLDGRTALALSAVWRCVTLIADVIADWPWQEWKGDELLESSRLVRRPMATMTRREWTWRTVATGALFGVTHELHVGGTDGAGAPWSLLPVPPSSIAPSGYVDPYYLTPPTAYTIAGRAVSAEYVTVIRRTPFPGVPDWMNGVINIARMQFSSYLAADYTSARYWRAGGPIATVIKTDDVIDDTEADDIAQRWLNHRARGNDYPVVLGHGADAHPWGADPTAEASVEAIREINAMVGRYFGLPTRILNAPAGDSETYANVEDDALDLYRLCLRGHAGPIEDAISELLPGDPLAGRRMLMDPSRFLQGDLASRAIAWPAIVAAGIADADEARVRGFGLPPRASMPNPSSTSVAIIAGTASAATATRA